MATITILEDETFPYQYVDADTGVVFDTTFTLREVPEDVEQAARRKHTPRKWHRGRDVGELNWAAFSADMLDYAIVSWDKLVGISRVNGVRVERDLPCVREHKARLPERVKADILRVALGRDAGQVVASEETEGPAPTAPDVKSGSPRVSALAG